LKYALIPVILASLTIIGCTSDTSSREKIQPGNVIYSESVTIIDTDRNRPIPMEIYQNTDHNHQRGLAIVNAGYGSSNTEYTYLCRHLAELDYFVVSTHHEQPNDPMIPTGDSIFLKRLPMWSHGILNVEAIIDYVKNEYSNITSDQLLLAGHSNGGDIAVLFASRTPEKVNALITLDHRRVPLPRNPEFPIITFRSNNYEADPGVLPETNSENITVVPLEVGHNYYRDIGSKEIKKAVCQEIDKQLLH